MEKYKKRAFFVLVIFGLSYSTFIFNSERKTELGFKMQHMNPQIEDANAKRINDIQEQMELVKLMKSLEEKSKEKFFLVEDSLLKVKELNKSIYRDLFHYLKMFLYGGFYKTQTFGQYILGLSLLNPNKDFLIEGGKISSILKGISSEQVENIIKILLLNEKLYKEQYSLSSVREQKDEEEGWMVVGANDDENPNENSNGFELV